MEEMNIYTLLTIIRGFSNEITVRALSNDLGISYSTLARCKNGVWPRSVTRDAMKNVLDDCKDRFFKGNGEALAKSVLLQLNGKDIETSWLQDALAKSGYDGFVSDLLAYAEDAEAYISFHKKQAETAAKDTAQNSSKRTQHKSEVFFAIPIALILLVGMFNVSLTSMLGWAANNRLAFFVVSLLIALLPALCGVAIDSPLAWRAYKSEHPDTPLSLRSFALVAKFGDVDSVQPGAGRFNFALEFFLYQPVCNICGMLCYVALFSFLLTLPDFFLFFSKHEWTEFFKVGIVVAYFIAYAHMRSQSTRTVYDVQGTTMIENPDTYLPTRAHVCANAVHLVWTISLLIVLLLSLIAYSIVGFRTLSMPSLMLWPYLHSMAFFFFACTSRLAIRLRAACTGVLLPGVAATSAGFLLLSVACYLPSAGTVLMCTACVLFTLVALAWVRTHSSSDHAEWISESRESGTYSVAVAASIFILLVIGFATSAFL